MDQKESPKTREGRFIMDKYRSDRTIKILEDDLL